MLYIYNLQIYWYTTFKFFYYKKPGQIVRPEGHTLSQGRFTLGTLRPRDVLFWGGFVQGTFRPGIHHLRIVRVPEVICKILKKFYEIMFGKLCIKLIKNWLFLLQKWLLLT
jgi:hypothetical protein